MRILGNGFIIRDVETCMNKDKKNEMIMKVNFIEFCNNQIKFITIMFFARIYLLCSTYHVLIPVT